MHLRKLPDGCVRLSHIDPWELRTFRALPELADFSTDPRAEQRLLPTPAVDEDLSPEMAMDWVEYVVPELRDVFAKNLDMVMADLHRLTVEPVESEETAENEADDLDDTDDGDEDEDEETEEDGRDEENDVDGSDPDVFSGTDDAAKDGQVSENDVSPEPLAAVEFFTLEIPAEHVEPWYRALNQARIVLSCRFGVDSEHLPDLPRLLESGELEYWFQYELFARLQGWFVEAVLDPE